LNKISSTCLLIFIFVFQFTDGSYLYGQTRVRKVVTKQQSFFKFGIIAGPVLSQLDGDGHTGYNKLGIYSGLKGEAFLSNNFTFEVDLAFSMLGSKFPQESPNSRITEGNRKIFMNFAEVPFILNIKLPHKKYPLNLELGLGLQQLISYKVDEDDFSAKFKSFSTLESSINKRNYAGIIGIERFHNNLTVGVRATFALNYQFYNETYFENLQQRKSIDNLVPLLRSYYISLVGSYTIFGTKS
jgi:hypothetical protein